MKKLIYICLLILQPLLVLAGQPLSRDVVVSFYSVSDNLDKLEFKYPEEFKRMDTFSLSQRSEIINYVKSTRAYPEIHSVISANGFASFEDFFDVSIRLMSGIYKVQMQKMSPQEKKQLAMLDKTFDENLKMMQQSGMPDSMIAGMKAQFQETRAEQIEMKAALKNVSQADVKFVSDNFDWLMQFMSKETSGQDDG